MLRLILLTISIPFFFFENMSFGRIIEKSKIFSSLPEDVLGETFCYLEPKDSNKMKIQNKSLNTLHSKYLEEQSPYGVQLLDGKWYFIQKVIQDQRLDEIESYHSFNNLLTAFKSCDCSKFLSQFMIQKLLVETSQIILEELPFHERMTNLRLYHKLLSSELFESMYHFKIKSLDVFEALILFEQKIQLSTQEKVLNQLWMKIWLLAQGSFWSIGGEDISRQVETTIKKIIEAQKISGRADIILNDCKWNKNRRLQINQVSKYINKNINRLIEKELYDLFDFAANFKQENLFEGLSLLTEYNFIVFQLSNIILSHSTDFTSLNESLIEGRMKSKKKYLSKNIGNSNYLIETHFKILSKIKNNYDKNRDS